MLGLKQVLYQGVFTKFFRNKNFLIKSIWISEASEAIIQIKQHFVRGWVEVGILTDHLGVAPSKSELKVLARGVDGELNGPEPGADLKGEEPTGWKQLKQRK